MLFADESLLHVLITWCQGEVWKGQLRGIKQRRAQEGVNIKDETVALKKAIYETGKKPWDEAEISFMMNMQHPKLVQFIGAGQIWDDANQGYVLFSVQVVDYRFIDLVVHSVHRVAFHRNL